MVSFANVCDAQQRIAPYVNNTPILTSTKLNALFSAELFFKCEHLQKVGAFKARGATNAVMLRSDEELKNGVATHSSGNHAQALAYAAQLRGVSCFVVMPENSPRAKVEATRGYGAHVHFCENTLQARESTLENIVEETGAVFIHPFDNDDVIAGQGTAALELLEQQPDLDVVMAPVGGGGLMSGTSVAARGVRGSEIRIIGAEPELANDALVSLQSGTIQPPKPPITIADGLRTALSQRTFEHLRGNNVEIITCSEESITRGMELIFTYLKQVVEPSATVTLGCLLENPHIVEGQKVGVILCGGNVDRTF